jgi:hypothetical protein
MNAKVTSIVRLGVLIAAAVPTFVLSDPTDARAADIPKSTNAPPTGPGTEAPPFAHAHGVRAVEGYQGSLQVGTGFVDTYGIGVGGRAGYTFANGIYAGAAATYYWGNSVTTSTGDVSAHATFVGAEGGYELFPNRRWEIRPYVFVGPSWIRTVHDAPFLTESKTRFAVQPGLLAAYHFGDAYVSAEAKIHATPSPTALTVFGGAGLGF